jgi:hypothetical protein
MNILNETRNQIYISISNEIILESNFRERKKNHLININKK